MSVDNRGTWGRNVWRDMEHRFRASKIFSVMRTLSAPLRNAGGMIFEGRVPILLPHRLIAKMYECYRESFMDRMLGGDAGNINRFWTAMEKHPAYVDHPMHTHSRSDHRKFGIPIGMHFDGVVSTGSGRKWARMIESFSWSSHLCKRGASWFRNFLICLVQKIMLAKEGADTTMNCVWRELCWSLYWCYQGVQPDRDSSGRLYTPEDGWLYDHRGEPLAGGYFLVVWTLKVDLEWLRDYIKLVGAGVMCALCGANSSDVPWTGCAFDCEWVGSVWSDATHLARFPNRHKLLRHVPGVTIHAWVPDWLHTKHIGCDSYFLGSILMALFIDCGLAGSNADKLAFIWNGIVDAYASLGIHKDRMTSLSFGMFQNARSKIPSLKLRGNVMKKLAPVLRLVWVANMDVGRAEHRNIKLGLDNCIEIDRLLDDHANLYALPENAGIDLKRNCFEFCQILTALIGHYHPGQALFNFTIKTHYLMHFGQIGMYMNPALGACHEGEDLMKVVKRLVVSSATGLDMQGQIRKAFAKYARGLAMDLDKDTIL